MNHPKTQSTVSMETKVVSGDSLLDKFSEKFDLNGFWKRNMLFAGGGGAGGGAQYAPLLVFGAQEKPGWDRVSVFPRLFTSHPHSYNNDLQTTLWVTQRCFIRFKRFDNTRLRQWNSVLRNLNSSWPLKRSTTEVSYCSDSSKHYLISLSKTLIDETFETNRTSLFHPKRRL